MSARTVLAFLAALTLGVAVLFAAGCGGDSASADSTGAPAEVAKLVPATSPFYIELNTNLDDVQWAQALAVAKRFPAYAEAEAEFNRELEEAKLDFDADIRPLLGGRAAIAAVDVAVSPTRDGSGVGEADGGFIAVMQLEEGNEAKVLELITRDGDLEKAGQHEGVDYYRDTDDDTVGAIADGFLVIADKEEHLFQALDLIGGSGDRLSDVDKFKDALDGLPEGGIARMYFDVGGLAGNSLSSIPQAQLGINPEGVQDAAMGAVLLAEDEGMRLKGKTVGAEGLGSVTEFTPSLPDQLPGNAVAYFGFADLAGQLGQVVTQLQTSGGDDIGEQLSQAAGQLDALLGVSVDDLSALASGEHAVVVTGEGDRVGVGAVLDVEDGARATATLDKLRAALPSLAGFAGGGASVPQQFNAAPLANGVSGWQLPLQDGISLVYGVDGDKVLLGSSPQATRALQGGGDALAASPRYLADVAGMPEQVTGVFWMDLKGALALPAFQNQLDAEGRRDLAQLEPLSSIVTWSTGGSEPEFEMFARVE